MFEKGKAPKSPGRPKGSKDKSYLKLEFWFNEMMKDWDKIRPAQRVKTSAQLMQMLTNKLKGLPSDPNESVSNAKDAQKLLAEIEGKANEYREKKDSEDVLDPINTKPPEIDSQKSH